MTAVRDRSKRYVARERKKANAFRHCALVRIHVHYKDDIAAPLVCLTQARCVAFLGRVVAVNGVTDECPQVAGETIGYTTNPGISLGLSFNAAHGVQAL